MSEFIRVRLVLARFHGDTEPVVVGAIDETIWEHWDDEDEAAWLAARKKDWGMDPTDCEWSEAWAEFVPDELVAAFVVPAARPAVSAATTRDDLRRDTLQRAAVGRFPGPVPVVDGQPGSAPSNCEGRAPDGGAEA